MSDSLPLSDDDLVTLVVETLPKGSDLLAIYFFGSAASGRMRSESDIDLAVLASVPMDPLETFDAAQRLATIVKRDVDLVDLRRSSTIMRAHVISSGRRLQCRDQLAVETFEMYAYSDYARLQEERRPVVAAMEKRHGG